jgi:UDP-N-acetylmuramoyl-L-alanyl-D-glutamate--2,6-diaminopimelate ligase
VSPPARSLPLAALLDPIEGVEPVGDLATPVTAVTADSRLVVPGALFCCVRGSRADGHDRAPEAVAAGAAALLCDHRLDLDVPQAVVADPRAALGPVAARFWGDPSHHLDVVGITGTNGKTTSVAMLHAVLVAAGRPAAMIGTLGGGGAGGVPRPPTTPDAPDLQARLAELREDGVTAVAMEVSSHALVQHRVAGTRFAVAVFTNLSRDHLDLHETMEQYFAAKARLFEPDLTERAVVNVDDPRGRLLADAARIPTRPFSLRDASDVEVGLAASTFTWRGRTVRLPLGGLFNVRNALGAATAALELGIGVDAVVEGLGALTPVAGRFEVVEAGPPVTVVVDYAHTPDGLEQLLRAARPVGDGRLLVVFGCGGERDREKRPVMGAVAATLSDVAVITSDNPRSEDPLVIVEQVRAGARGDAEVVVEPDRRSAIATALQRSRPGDVVVVAGKGHETTQTVGNRVVPFDDRVVAREELDRLAGAGAGAAGR